MNHSAVTTKPSTILAGILLSIVLYIGVTMFRMQYLSQRGTDGFSDKNSFFISRLILWLYLLLIWLWVMKMEKEKLLAWPERKHPALFYLLSVITMLGAIILMAGLLHNIEKNYGWDDSVKLKAMLQVLWKNKLLLLFTTLSAGIMEELVFRGYLIPRLIVLVKSTWPAIIISSLLFGLAHYTYGNWAQMINPFFIGLLFGWHYQKFRNIKVLMLCHFLIDFLSVLSTH